MFVKTKRTLFIVTFLILGLLALGTPIDAQTDSQNLLMTNMNIYAELIPDCNTTILLETEFTNQDSVEISSFGIRVDVRWLYVNEATIDGLHVDTITRSVDNYVIVSFIPDTAIPVSGQGDIFLNFTTMCLQERIGLNSDGSMYDSQLIYYIRSLNEIQNLTFSASLPQHAILDQESAAPLYPRPTTNHTDGRKPVYVWYLNTLLPGQEVVYIIKYQLPTAIIDTAPAAVTSSPIFIVIISAVLAGLAVLTIERIPSWLKRFNSRELIVSGKISSQEQEILDLLNVRGGKCPQREIYEELDMSQSMTSMMLTSLEGRGLIRRLRSGRENIVHIMED